MPWTEGRAQMKLREAEQGICNVYALLADLKYCSARRDLQWGRRIHAKAVKCGHDSDRYVVTALIKMNSNCGSMADARRVFDCLQKPDVVAWTALLLGYAENGEGHVSLELFSKMKAVGCAPNSVTYVSALKACTSLAANGDLAQGLKMGRTIHLETCHLNLCTQSAVKVQNTLIHMYAKCGSMVEARQVFDCVHKPTIVSWNALLLGYAENGEERVTLELFSKMKADGFAPNCITYVAVLKACTSLAVNGNGNAKTECLETGSRIHSEVADHMDHYVQSMLIDFYAKCNNMFKARQVFDTIKKPDVVLWNALLLGYADNGEGLISLELFSKMKARGCTPNSVTYIAAIKACTSLVANGDGSTKSQCLELGRSIHSETTCHCHMYQNTLIVMYAKCGSMADARQVFDTIQKPDVVSWNALLWGYAENGDGHTAIELLSKMSIAGCILNSITHVAALKACGLIGALAYGRKLHSDITEFSTHTVTCLVDFYAKCGSMVEAREVFDRHVEASDITTWTALLAGYSSCGDTASGFKLFEAMQDKGFQPDSVTFVCILLCCSHAGLTKKASQYLEAMPVQYGVTPDVYHYNCMVDVLCRANRLFEAVSVLRRMPCRPNAVTWTALLGSCRKWKNLEIGRMAFQSLVEIDKKDAPAYVVMGQIYGSRGMWNEQHRVMKSRTNYGGGAPEQALEQAYVADETGKMVKFVVGREDPPELQEKLTQLLQQSNTTRNAAADGGGGAGAPLCGHCERRAVVYGILKTPPGEPVRAFKNTRMCGDCHESIKWFAKLCSRTVMVRDATRFHLMVNGSCSCRDQF